MRIIFMGTPDFAVPSLKSLVNNGYEPIAVVTAPDRQRGRGRKFLPTPVKTCALEYGLPCLQPDNLKSEDFLDEVRSLHPDLACVVAFRILPEKFIAIPSRGSVNLHASLLPRYRGAAPIQRALMAGETETGVTTFIIEKKVDTGDILLQHRIPILPEDNAGTLHDRLASVGAKLLLDTVKGLDSGSLIKTPQDGSLATPARKVLKEDRHIDWSANAADIHNLIRALSPYPGAFTHLAGTLIKIYNSGVVETMQTGIPGELLASNEGEIIVATGKGALKLLELQREGKARMNSTEFSIGFHLNEGDRFA